MLDLSRQVEQIDLVSGPGPSTRISLGPPNSDYGIDVQLIGVPGPGLFGRHVSFENPGPACGIDEPRWQRYGFGALLEARWTPPGTVSLRWCGVDGYVSLRWENAEVTLHEGDPLEEEPSWYDKRAADIGKHFRRDYDNWRPSVEIEEKSLAYLGGKQERCLPMADLVREPRLASVSELGAHQRESVVLELVAKLARFRAKVDLCEHARFSTLYTWLSQLVLPSTSLPVEIPKGSIQIYSSYEHCAECSCALDIEAQGPECLWPPEPCSEGRFTRPVPSERL